MRNRHCGRCGRCGQCIREGSRIRVRDVDFRHPSARKLKDMGIGKGCSLEVERLSPFGDPCIVRVKGYSLAVRRRDFEALDLEETAEKGV